MLKFDRSRHREARTLTRKTTCTIAMVALLAAAMAAFPNPVSPANSDPLAALIARARAALGPGLPTIRSTYVTGTVETSGMSGTFQSWTDRTNGRYSTVIDMGPLSSSEGYDGSTAWWRDSKGVVLPQTGPSSRANTVTETFFGSDALFKPDHGGATLSYLGTRTDSGRTYEAIEVRVPDGDPMKHWYTVEEWFDAATALLGRWMVNNNGVKEVADFSDYQSVNGLMVARQVRFSHDGTLTQTVKVTQARADVPDLEAHLRRSASAVNDFSLPGGQTIIPFKYVDHEIFVDVHLNGKGPFHFAFDSGGRNLMDPTIAWTVGAPAIGTSAPRGGIGEGTSIMQLARIGQLSIGGATLRDQYFRVAHIERPASFIGVQGFTYRPGAQGLIGWEVLARFVTTIDYAAGKIILRTPAVAAQTPAGHTIPLLFDGNLPKFGCRIAGVEGTCLVDTGSVASVIVTSPFARKHKNVVPQSLDATGYNVFGFGGRSRGARGQLASFQIGPITLTNLDAAFSSDRKGGLADSSIAAIVGNQVWSRFQLTLDYAHATMVLGGSPALDGH
jgi:hypothetical protein